MTSSKEVPISILTSHLGKDMCVFGIDGDISPLARLAPGLELRGHARIYTEGCADQAATIDGFRTALKGVIAACMTTPPLVGELTLVISLVQNVDSGGDL